MALYGPATATATVAANTNSVAITNMDLSLITPGMTINLGARDRKTGDAWIISSVTPSGSNGGTVTTQGNISTAYNSAPFVIDTTGYLGTDASYAAAVGLAILSTLSTLLGVATNLYSGARQLVLDKVAASTVSRIVFSIAGRSWGDIVQRTFAYTPAGGQATSIETLAVRAFSDGTTPTDALLFDLSNGTGDLRKGAAVMASAATVDLGSAPAGKVSITGTTTISSFGPGKNLDRLGDFASSGGVIKHSASLVLSGGADIAIQAGDTFHATSDGAGNWRVRYQRGNGKALVPFTPAEAGAQPALGFTPVQQGGGAGQATNKLYLGWSGSALKAQVDLTDLGNVWTDQLAGSSYGASGYAKLPSGLILQWGQSQNSNPDFVQLLPIAFPNAMVFAAANANLASDTATAYTARTEQYGKNSFVIRARNIASGGSVVGFASQRIDWFALGY